MYQHTSLNDGCKNICKEIITGTFVGLDWIGLDWIRLENNDDIGTAVLVVCVFCTCMCVCERFL